MQVELPNTFLITKLERFFMTANWYMVQNMSLKKTWPNNSLTTLVWQSNQSLFAQWKFSDLILILIFFENLAPIWIFAIF